MCKRGRGNLKQYRKRRKRWNGRVGKKGNGIQIKMGWENGLVRKKGEELKGKRHGMKRKTKVMKAGRKWRERGKWESKKELILPA